MRKPPFIRLYSPFDGVGASWYDSVAAANVLVSSGDIGENYFHVDTRFGTAGNPVSGHYTADADF